MTILATIDMGEGLIIGVLVLGVTVILGFLSKLQGQTDRIVDTAVAKAKAAIANEPPKREFIGSFEQKHPFIQRPEFDALSGRLDRHERDTNTNIATINQHIARLLEVREQNGERLGNLEASVAEYNRTLGELTQAVHDLSKRHA